MSLPLRRLLAWALLALTLVILGLAVLVTVAADQPLSDGFVPVLATAVWAGVGAALSLARPRNAVGWLLLATGVALGLSVTGTCDGAIQYGLEHPGSIPGLGGFALVSSAAFTAFFLLFFLVLLLLPNGKLLTARWRIVGWGIALLGAVQLTLVVRPGPFDDWVEEGVLNPFGVQPRGGRQRTARQRSGTAPRSPARALLYPTGKAQGPRWSFVLRGLIAMVVVLTVLFMFYPGPLDDSKPPLPDNPVGIGALESLPGGDGIISISFLLLLVAAASSMIVRFRRSRGDERQQMKWMTFAAVFLIAGLVLPDLVGIQETGDVFFAISVCLLPIAMGIAMLKYRLYDIDRLINRTLVYAALTVVLGAAYVGLVLGGQTLFSSSTGGSNLAIAASTLVVAALFLPVRSRVNRFVDRRFYRRRYDAQRTLEGFGARLREQIELETLSTDLALVVQETIQPSHVSLWLRSGR